MTASQHLQPLTARSSLLGWFGVVPQLAGDLDMSLKPLSLLDRNIRAESPLSLRGRIPPDPKHEGPEIPVWRWTFFKLEQLWAGHELQIQIWSLNASFFLRCLVSPWGVVLWFVSCHTKNVQPPGIFGSNVDSLPSFFFVKEGNVFLLIFSLVLLPLHCSRRRNYTAAQLLFNLTSIRGKALASQNKNPPVPPLSVPACFIRDPKS